MSAIMQLDIVSAEAELFSGEVTEVSVTGVLGELGILPGHTPLLTSLRPGQVYADLANGESQVFYVSGGILEVQPNHVTVLSDTAQRAEDLDEAAAKEAEEKARAAMSEQGSEIAYSEAAASLANAVAQLEAIRKLREKLKV